MQPRPPPQVLQPGGLLTVVSYTRHPGGQEEYEAVTALLRELRTAYWVRPWLGQRLTGDLRVGTLLASIRWHAFAPA